MVRVRYIHRPVKAGIILVNNPVKDLNIISHNSDDTISLGRKIGELAMSGDVFLLSGILGAGKTCLTQGIAYGLGINEYTLSPSFVLVRELYGRLTLYHMDLYRLENIQEIAELGLDDYLYGRGICAIEWANRGMPLFPEEHLSIEIVYKGDTERQIIFKAHGQRYIELLEKFENRTE
ncbi:MAG TPA: tRNA (adenosine(37)-N6)-threonylcarbamoyltransferase complex ATPase subunit type 1 TsaE [Dehalococcoidia bacterium]|nr:tRNA (adenosine(37)-N6)-threonylcarbamoyltransferase complex ATPase subunit type 1 TsaE [Dehalococcoidia bacterium]HAS28138.1 tRNA (adenosine(37)-N6)-threonylcarbamoyltransferase complex ATPase subunit type 1 TsaE [Dehalococcoidia bacterium]